MSVDHLDFTPLMLPEPYPLPQALKGEGGGLDASLFAADLHLAPGMGSRDGPPTAPTDTAFANLLKAYAGRGHGSALPPPFEFLIGDGGGEPVTSFHVEGDPEGDDDGDGIPNNVDEDSIIVVTGKRPRTYNPDPGTDTGGGGGTSTGGSPTPPNFETCQDTSTMTPEQKEDYEVAKVAAEIARQIQEMADRDSVEYGAIIFRGADGVITHTRITRGGSTSVAPSVEGLPGWGDALAMVHSHPALLYVDGQHYLRLHPTPDAAGPSGQGDWYGFNYIQAMMRQDLMSKGYSEAAATTKANEFVQFVYGATGPKDTGKYELHRYDDTDDSLQNKPSPEQVAAAEKVSINLGLCNG